MVEKSRNFPDVAGVFHPDSTYSLAVKHNSRLILAFTACLLAFVSTSPASESDDVRLSRTLIPSEYADAGLKQLSSDQVAIIDALVRRDTAAFRRTSETARPARFSERLSIDERNNAGLSLLSESEHEALDRYVARLTAPIDSPSGSFAAGRPFRTPFIADETLRRAPEIHGMISLTFGMGSGGYSERGGAMVLTYDDPSGISLAVGYSEIRTKGGYFLRDYHYRDRYRGFEPGLW